MPVKPAIALLMAGEAPGAAADVPESPPRPAGVGSGSTLGSPPQAWGLSGLPEGVDAGTSADALAASLRQGSSGSSPWHFQLNVKAASRVRSGERSSGVSTPILAQRYGAARALSSGRTTVQPAARASYESALLNAVRRQIETFEEKVGSQINSIRDQQHGDRLREAAFARLEEKMNTAEGLQPRLDRRLAELTGNFKGLSDEMQAQIRRVDLMDERLWEWRRQFEEEFRQKHADLENGIQKVPTGMRVMATTLEEGQKRLAQRVHRLEVEVGERLALHDETRDSVNHMWARFDALENQRLEDHNALIEARASQNGAAPRDLFGDDNATLIKALEQRLNDLVDKVERMFQDAHDVHARIAEQDEQQKTLRTLCETTDQHVRHLKELVENGNWDSKVEQLRQAVQEESKLKLDHHERLELLAKRLEYQDQAQEELRGMHRSRGLDGEDGMVPAPLQELAARLEQAEAHLEVHDVELEAARVDTGLGSRVSELVLQLKEVGPKVIDHEKFIKELCTDKGDAFASQRMGQLEDKVTQLTEKLAEKRSEEARPAEATPEVLGALESLRGEVEKLRVASGGEEVATVSALTAALETLRKEIDQVKSASESALVEGTGSLRGDLDRVRASTEELAGVVEPLRQEFRSLADSVPERLAAQAAEADSASKQALKEFESSLGSLSSSHTAHGDALQTLRTSLRAVEERTAGAGESVTKQELSEAIERLRQECSGELARLAELAEAGKQMATTVLTEMGSLKQDLTVTKKAGADTPGATAQDLQHLRDLAIANKDAADGAAGDIEGLRQDFGSLREKIQEVASLRSSIQKEAADLIEPVREEVASLRSSIQKEATDLIEPVREELRALATAREAAAQAAVTEREDGLESLRSALKELQERSKSGEGTLQDELGTLKQELASCRSGCEATWQEQVRPVMEELKRLTELSADSREVVAGVLSEVDGLKQQLAAAQAKAQDAVVDPVVKDALEALRRDHEALRAAARAEVVTEGAFTQECDAIKKEVADVRYLAERFSQEISKGTVVEVESLRRDMEELRETSQMAERLQQELASQRETLKVLEAGSAGAADLQRLKSDVEMLQAKLPVLATVQASKAESVEAGAAPRDAAELVEADEAERQAQAQLLTRVDELSQRLADVIAAMAAAMAAPPCTAVPTAASLQANSGITAAAFADKLESLVNRAEAQQGAEHQTEAKLIQLTQQMQAKMGSETPQPEAVKAAQDAESEGE